MDHMWSTITLHHLLFLHLHCLALVLPTCALLPAAPPIHIRRRINRTQDLDGYGNGYHALVHFHVQKIESGDHIRQRWSKEKVMEPRKLQGYGFGRRGDIIGDGSKDVNIKKYSESKIIDVDGSRKGTNSGTSVRKKKKRRRNFMKKQLAQIQKRMGSRPPLCSNKCNACHPCLAIQVPTPLFLSNNKRSRPSTLSPAHSLDHDPHPPSSSITLDHDPPNSRSSSSSSSSSQTFLDPSKSKRRPPLDYYPSSIHRLQHSNYPSSSFSHLDYSNYQPEGWKCKCGDLIFNP